jgi:hypothetical protein
LTQLTTINLSGNAITRIPPSVQNLQGLQQLLLARNQLESLPAEVGSLAALTELDVGRNRMQQLPDTLCNLTGLQVGGVGDLAPFLAPDTCTWGPIAFQQPCTLGKSLLPNCPWRSAMTKPDTCCMPPY